jgi:hypothetical protein
MFDQTPINRLNGMSWNKPVEGNPVQSQADMNGVRQLLADVTELAELQTRLLADDVRSSLYAFIRPLVYIVGGVVILLATLPVVLLAFANLLVAEAEWPTYAAQFTCAGSALLAAGVLAVLAYRRIQRSAIPLQRSMCEMQKNLETLREMLVGHKAVSDSVPRRESQN